MVRSLLNDEIRKNLLKTFLDVTCYNFQHQGNMVLYIQCFGLQGCRAALFLQTLHN